MIPERAGTCRRCFRERTSFTHGLTQRMLLTLSIRKKLPHRKIVSGTGIRQLHGSKSLSPEFPADHSNSWPSSDAPLPMQRKAVNQVFQVNRPAWLGEKCVYTECISAPDELR